MIESLHIENLGVIEQAELPLSPGLTALTGETGAGKTMVLTSLGLLLGQRAESTIVRTGAQRALVEGAFTLDPASRAASRARQAGAELDDDLLIATRTVPASGRSRAHLGGRAVPSSVLTDIGSHLVSVHGQTEQLRLRSAAAQRAALDSLGGPEHAGLCRRYAEAYRARREAAEALDHWRAGAQARQEEAERLREWLEALEALEPSPGEDHELTAEAERLDHAEDLRLAAGTARTALVGQEDVIAPGQADAAALLAAAQRALAGAPGEDDRLAELAGRTRQLSVLTADIAADLGEYLVSLDADPARLAWIQDRRGELARACRDIGGSATEIDDVDALLAWGRRAADRLAELDGAEDSAASLEQALDGAHAALDEAAGQLTAARRALAGRLEAAVTAEIDGLQMKGARLVVELEPLDEPGPTGAEAISLMLVSHPGAPALPLSKGASGGELSRIMLALEVVLADAAGAPQPGAAPSHQRTFVFDEIDAGVGGRAAREIGRRLARLARRHQVVVVTHLAQVAAWADTQLVVVKETKRAKGNGQTQDTAVSLASLGESPDDEASAGMTETSGTSEISEATRTRVVQVVGSERVTELARMLSGHERSEAALRHAAELLEEASMGQSPT